ncbi:MAG: hypothetical protein AAB263_07915 [Planctomycetota bacterium]
MRYLLPLLGLCVLLVGCSTSREFRVPAYNRNQALARTEVMELKVIKVWSVTGDALDHDRELGISHYIEVDVIGGTQAGNMLSLPYDEWNVGKAPPAEGSTVIVAPADWVKRAKDTKGRPSGM